MIKHCLRHFILVFAFTSFISIEGKAQLIGTGLVDDPERNIKAEQTGQPHFKIAATTYSDTLQLPFFEDFTDVVVPIDSIVINNTVGYLVRIYDNVLNSYPDGTLICAGFLNSNATATTKKIAGKKWYIKKIGINEFLIDSSAGLTTPMTINVDTIIKTSFWRLFVKKYSTELDSLKWQKDGNIYINNRYPSKPVSYHVATFDGLKSDGIPYNTTNTLAKGFSDHLTSLPINLKSYTAADNIYLSYFWQHSGIGDSPEAEDYLQLEFKDSTGVWNIIKTINGNQSYMDTFKIDVLPLVDPIYFSNHFQFRFRAYGRLSGAFDIWNVDHIYLNKNRNINDTLFNDKSIGNVPATFLKRYTAMPYNQFFADTVAESGDMIFTVNNLGRGIINTEFFNAFAYNISQPNNILFSRDTALTHYPGNISYPNDKVRTFQDTCTPKVKTLVNIAAPIYIDQRFQIPANDTSNILYANNNTFNNITILWDYYAYDDGSPEWSVGANQSGSKLANLFTIKLMDTLTHIDIYFTRSKGPNMAGRTILLSVWDNTKTLVSQQIVQVAYGGFKRYKLNTPVIVNAGMDYYVGYQQNFVDLLTVGYDKAYDHSDKVFFNLSGNDWNPFNAQPGYVKGSMMIRPVFNKNQTLITAVIEEEEELSDIILFPVPTNQSLKIQGRVSSASLYDLTGRKLCTQSFDPFQEEKEINTTALSNGLYLVELKIKDQTVIKKIIVQHEF